MQLGEQMRALLQLPGPPFNLWQMETQSTLTISHLKSRPQAPCPFGCLWAQKLGCLAH